MIAIAVDDEVLMLGALVAAIKASPDISAIEKFSSCEEALEYVKDYTAMDFEYMAEPNRVQITCEYGECPVVEAKRNSEVRYRAGVKSPILTEVKKGDVLYVLEEPEEIEKWTRVRTANGYIGYIV